MRIDTLEDLIGAGVFRAQCRSLALSAKRTDLIDKETFQSYLAKQALETGKARYLVIAERQLSATVEAHLADNGGRPGVEDYDAATDWDGKLDDAIEALLDGARELLGLHFVQEVSIDTRTHQEGEIAKLATRITQHAFKSFAQQKETTAKILSSAGVTVDDVADLFKLATEHKRGNPKEQDMTAHSLYMAVRIVGEYADMLGGVDSVDQKYLRSELETIGESDDILSDAAINRLGGSPDNVEAFRELSEKLPNWIDAVLNGARQWPNVPAPVATAPAVPVPAAAGPPVPPPLPPAPAAPASAYPVEAAPVAGAVAPPPPPGPPAPPRAPVAAAGAPPPPPGPPAKVRKPRSDGALKTPPDPTKPAPAPAALPALVEALKLMKEHGGMADKDIYETLVISRSTLSNALQGKSHLAEPDAATKRKFQEIIRQKMEGLTVAFQKLS